MTLKNSPSRRRKKKAVEPAILNISFVTYDPETGEVHSFHRGHPHAAHDARYSVAEYRNITHAEATRAPDVVGGYELLNPVWKVDLGSIQPGEHLPLVELVRA